MIITQTPTEFELLRSKSNRKDIFTTKRREFRRKFRCELRRKLRRNSNYDEIRDTFVNVPDIVLDLFRAPTWMLGKIWGFPQI